MPLWLTEDDVASLVTPGEAVPVIEECFRRMAAGQVELMPRRRFQVEGGAFAVMAAADTGIGVAGLKSYTVVDGRAVYVVCLFDLTDGSLSALIAADRLGQVRTGAASGVAAKHLARHGAASLGLIGAGWQAESQLAAIRAAVPTIERVVVSAGRAARAAAFAERNGAEVAESPQEAGGCDIVVTVTSSKDPVLRGDWLQEGALVCAVGANVPHARELDAEVIARATLVCCDAIEDARLESGDLIEPVAAGQLDWLEVHELHAIVAGEVPGRQADSGHRRLQVERDRAVGRRDRPRGRAARARTRRRRRALNALFLAEGDLLGALPEELLPERAEALVALDDRREVVSRQLARLRGEVDVAVREQDLRLGDAAGVEDDLARVGIGRRVLRAEPQVEVAERDPAALARPADVDDLRLERKQPSERRNGRGRVLLLEARRELDIRRP